MVGCGWKRTSARGSATRASPRRPAPAPTPSRSPVPTVSSCSTTRPRRPGPRCASPMSRHCWPRRPSATAGPPSTVCPGAPGTSWSTCAASGPTTSCVCRPSARSTPGSPAEPGKAPSATQDHRPHGGHRLRRRPTGPPTPRRGRRRALPGPRPRQAAGGPVGP